MSRPTNGSTEPPLDIDARINVLSIPSYDHIGVRVFTHYFHKMFVRAFRDSL